MSNLNGVKIQKGAVGANALAADTSTSAIIFNGVAVSGKLALNTAYVVSSLIQAENSLGITAAYDTANHIVAHQHIADFYSYKENENAKLYIMCVAMSALPADVLEDVNNEMARLLITQGGGKIKQIAYALNLATNATETKVDGLNSLIRAAISKAQALYDWSFENDKPCHIFLEGRAIADDTTTLLDLRNIVAGAAVLQANKVSIVIGQDYDYAESRNSGNDVLCAKYAGVGKALGTVAAADVNQSMAEVDEATGGFNLSNATKGTWITGALSNHKTIAVQDDYLFDIDAKGYIFPITHTGVSGLRWNGDHVCCPIIVDEDGKMNEHTIYYGRTMDLIAMELKVYLTKWLKKRVTADATTGLISKAVLKQLEASATQAVINKKVQQQTISGGKTTLTQQVDDVTNKTILKPDFEIVPTLIIDEVNGTVYLKKYLSV